MSVYHNNLCVICLYYVLSNVARLVLVRSCAFSVTFCVNDGDQKGSGNNSSVLSIWRSLINYFRDWVIMVCSTVVHLFAVFT